MSYRRFVPRLLLALAALGALPGCGWYYLEPDANLVATQAMAPEFTLPAADGDPVSLADLRERGDVVLVFYRGHW